MDVKVAALMALLLNLDRLIQPLSQFSLLEAVEALAV